MLGAALALGAAGRVSGLLAAQLAQGAMVGRVHVYAGWSDQLGVLAKCCKLRSRSAPPGASAACSPPNSRNMCCWTSTCACGLEGLAGRSMIMLGAALALGAAGRVSGLLAAQLAQGAMVGRVHVYAGWSDQLGVLAKCCKLRSRSAPPGASAACSPPNSRNLCC